ncbi:hypothetical protein CTKA_01311 [Chthonomonas calidirosea]|uniref:Uncharacterized protein n=1 Tax=Chthonomonas calidirosea (strain DSM 23976 / ICMP 18418 / T49) TaxID=1303518 RepID=S0EXD0_CHTCT|nr:hypothetical protein CCALI_02778 [Chthonomonas calidirosea T49]CEK16952.1 hypothetical protein CTKA_01311 [Chthonomonas calidirosea]
MQVRWRFHRENGGNEIGCRRVGLNMIGWSDNDLHFHLKDLMDGRGFWVLHRYLHKMGLCQLSVRMQCHAESQREDRSETFSHLFSLVIIAVHFPYAQRAY